MTTQRILVVDDEEIVRDSVSEWLKSNHYYVEYACDGHEAINKVRNSRFDTAVVDMKMPDIDGLEVTRQIKNLAPQTVVIMITAYGTVENAVEAMKLGVSDYLQKPFNPDELINVIEKNMVPAKEIKTELQSHTSDYKPLTQVTKEAGSDIIVKKSTTLFSRPFILGILAGIGISSGIAIAAYSLKPLISDTNLHFVESAKIITANESQNPIITNEIDYYKRLYPHLSGLFELYLQIDNLQQEYFDRIEPVMEIPDSEIKRRIAQGRFLLKGDDFPINQQLFQELKERLNKLLGKYNPKKSLAEVEEIIAFHALAPFYRREADKLRDKIDENAWLKGICPVCGTIPVMGKLAKNDGKLLLHCPLCRTNWRFPRVTCPFCDNTNQNTLGYFYTDNNKTYRVNVCEQCKKYIKIVDERILNKEPIFPIENIVTNYLDNEAKKEGYQTDG
ncbi:MAG: formate dehydrogenase accessory protein FdhE, partial [Planctomycetota bacterium]